MTMKSILPYLTLLGFVFVASCKHEIPTLPEPEPTDSTKNPSMAVLETDSLCDSSIVYFKNDILPILTSSCAYAGCHDANTKSDGVHLSDYDAIFNSDKDDLVVPGEPDKSELYDVLEDNEMPQGAAPLSAEQKQLFYDWISQGAKYNECIESSSGGCDTSNVSYASDIQPLLSARCVSCHSGVSAQKGVELDDYTKVKSHVDSGKLKDALLGTNGVSKMPQGSTLDQCDLDKFIKWINDGAPNN